MLHGNREGEVENAVLKWMRWEGFCYVILSFGYLSPLVENTFLFQIGKLGKSSTWNGIMRSGFRNPGPHVRNSIV